MGSLKNNDWVVFSRCFMSIVLFFVQCNGKGAHDYQRALYCFTMMLRYWNLHQLPIITLLQANHTLFSEESGEIALSVLANSQPTNNRSKIEQARKTWQCVRTNQARDKLAHGSLKTKKKHRILSKCLFCIPSRELFYKFFIFIHGLQMTFPRALATENL